MDGDYRIWFGATLGQTILILMTRFTGTIRHQDAINSGFPSSFVCQTRVIICCVECLTRRYSFGNTHLIPPDNMHPSIDFDKVLSIQVNAVQLVPTLVTLGLALLKHASSPPAWSTDHPQKFTARARIISSHAARTIRPSMGMRTPNHMRMSCGSPCGILSRSMMARRTRQLRWI